MWVVFISPDSINQRAGFVLFSTLPFDHLLESANEPLSILDVRCANNWRETCWSSTWNETGLTFGEKKHVVSQIGAIFVYYGCSCTGWTPELGTWLCSEKIKDLPRYFEPIIFLWKTITCQCGKPRGQTGIKKPPSCSCSSKKRLQSMPRTTSSTRKRNSTWERCFVCCTLAARPQFRSIMQAHYPTMLDLLYIAGPFSAVPFFLVTSLLKIASWLSRKEQTDMAIDAHKGVDWRDTGVNFSSGRE
mgnify:CR=1 FL=1